MKAFQNKLKLVDNFKVVDKYFKAILESAQIAQAAKPGQFLMLEVNQERQPLLKRPFSIHNVRPRSIELLYEVVGKGTEILSHKQPGEYLDVIGPLGKGFDYQLPITNYQP